MIFRLLLHLAVLTIVLDAFPSYGTEGPPPASRRESVLPSSDYTSLAKIVGQIILEVPDAGGGTVTTEVCSGFAISEKYIVTARHCFYSQAGGPVAFTAAYIRMGRTQQSGVLYLLKHEFAKEDPPSDFVVIETTKTIDDFSPALLKTSGSLLGNGQDLFILHYPGPGSMVLTRMDCRGSDPASIGDFIRHTCDTDPGSSGAPIFDGKFNLVGMHQEGGRSNDPNSYNKGIGIIALTAKSQIVQAAMAAANSQQKNEQAPTAPEYEYKANIGVGWFFIKRGDLWIYRIGPDEHSATALVEQSGPQDMWTFWNPSRDVLFQLPIAGGNLLSISAAIGTTYVKIGTASRTIGPSP